MSAGRRDPARELYPFLHPPEPAAGALDALLLAVQRSTLDKSAEVIRLRNTMLEEYSGRLDEAAVAMAARFASGGKLVAFGNGGSATDADDAAADCLDPPVPGWRALPALSLAADHATLSAVANDVGFESVFVRQLIAVGESGDIALAISTSGGSSNIMAGLLEAKRRGMLTIALAGGDGGRMARDACVDFCFVIRCDFVPRIQEVHATLWHTLFELVQRAPMAAGWKAA